MQSSQRSRWPFFDAHGGTENIRLQCVIFNSISESEFHHGDKKINYIKVNNINSNKKTKLIITLISKTCFIIMNFGAVVIT